MSNLFVRNIPSIKERDFKYRTQISSNDLNQMQTEAFNDILDLFNKANQLQKTIYEMNVTNSIESICYTKRLEAAINDLNRLNEMYNNLTDTEKEYRTISKFAYEANTQDNGYDATVDQNTNDIISHIVSSTSKTRLYDETYDEVLVPPSLQAYIGPDSFKVGGYIYSIEDSDVSNAFDGNNNSIWFRKVITSPDIEYIENEIVIALPEDIVTSKLINQLTLNPFPVGYVDIMDIQYKSNGAWQTIPGFTTHYGCTENMTNDIFGNPYTYHVIENASNLKFNFQNIQTSQLKIKLRQRNYEYDAENNRRIWYFGIRDINVVYNIYTKDHSEFEMIYEFSETDKNIKIYDSNVYFNNPELSDDNYFGVSKEYFYFDSNGNTHKISSTCPFILQGHKLMVRYTIEGNQLTPNIYKCDVKYKLT